MKVIHVQISARRGILAQAIDDDPDCDTYVAITTPFDVKAGAQALSARNTYTVAEYTEWLKSIGAVAPILG